MFFCPFMSLFIITFTFKCAFKPYFLSFTFLHLYTLKTLIFHLNYTTWNGDKLELVYSVDGGKTLVAPLHSSNNEHWHTEIALPDDSQNIRYAYQVVSQSGKEVRIEQNSWRIFRFCHRSHVCFCDAWADNALNDMFHRSAFSKCAMQPSGGEMMHMELFNNAHLLILHALPPTQGYKWAIVGESERLGGWDVKKALPLQRTDTYEWALPLCRTDFEETTAYKYILLNTEKPEASVWEEGNNRTLTPTNAAADFSIIRQDAQPRITLPMWKAAGVVIPVFSLRSEHSMGVGDFGDLLTMVRWAAEVGMKTIQLLPINDTTRTGSWHDSYPYNGISVFALHPLYLDMRPWKNASFYNNFAQRGARLNLLPQLDYEQAFALKMDFLRKLFSTDGKRTMKSATFKMFAADNAHWLPYYAAFCTLRDHFHTADFRQWGNDAPKPHDAKRFRNIFPQYAEAYDFYTYVQFLLHEQMLKVHTKAQEMGVILKGDIPIGISRDSVPAWVDTHLFHFNGQAGAPPDDFAIHGQNWGFPTYNWEEMAKDNYQWWRNRLQHMELYFDAYRIDHVLGFFRIWEVPTNQVYGLLGQFRPALPYSEQEIKSFGFQSNVKDLCLPYLSKEQAQDIENEPFGKKFVHTYLEPFGQGYVLKKDFRSQRYIEQTIHDEPLKNKLLDIACEVLFIADNSNPCLYHPRVMGRLSMRYTLLSAAEREAFDRLHDHFYYERNNQFWADEAMKKIPSVTNSPDTRTPTLKLYPLQGGGMLPCAEDLGMVPSSVKGVLERLQILSLEIQRMPKASGLQFAHLSDNPYLSVSTIATHDMPPLRLWWTQNTTQTQDYWQKALHHLGTAPTEATPEVCEEIIAQHLHSPSMLCLLALQDWLSLSPTLRNPHPETEQINVPSNPHQYWRYRMHITLERLLQSTDFNEKIRCLIAASSNQ